MIYISDLDGWNMYRGGYGTVPTALWELPLSNVPWINPTESLIIKGTASYLMTFNAQNNQFDGATFMQMNQVIAQPWDAFMTAVYKGVVIGMFAIEYLTPAITEKEVNGLEAFKQWASKLDIRVTPNLIDRQVIFKKYSGQDYLEFGRNIITERREQGVV